MSRLPRGEVQLDDVVVPDVGRWAVASSPVTLGDVGRRLDRTVAPPLGDSLSVLRVVGPAGTNLLCPSPLHCPPHFRPVLPWSGRVLSVVTTPLEDWRSLARTGPPSWPLLTQLQQDSQSNFNRVPGKLLHV